MKKGFIDPTGLPSGLSISLAIREDRPAVIQISFRKVVAGSQQSVSWSAVDEQSLWQGIKEALTNVVKIYKQFNIEFPRKVDSHHCRKGWRYSAIPKSTGCCQSSTETPCYDDRESRTFDSLPPINH